MGTLVQLGLTFVTCVVTGLGAGFWLDRWLRTEPWFLLAGLGIGIAAGFVNFFRVVSRAGRDE